MDDYNDKTNGKSKIKGNDKGKNKSFKIYYA